MTERSDDESIGQAPPDDASGLIDEAEEESFPASDPPTTWSGQDPRDLLDEPE